MTTRNYLNQLRTIDIEIAMSKSEAQSWLDLAVKLHHEPSDVRVDTSPVPDKMENLVVKAADCALKAVKDKEILVYKKERIEQQIKSVEDKDLRYMLWMYYHDRHSHKEVARQMGYTHDYERHQMDVAIKVFEKMFGHEYK